MKKYPIMQLIRKALFIFIISELKTYKRNCGTHNVHRFIYKTNAKTVQYLHVKTNSLLICNKKKLTIGISIIKVFHTF